MSRYKWAQGAVLANGNRGNIRWYSFSSHASNYHEMWWISGFLYAILGWNPTKARSAISIFQISSLVMLLFSAKYLIYPPTGQEIARMSSPSLPTFLKYLPECRVIWCRRHRYTFTSQDLDDYLQTFHRYSARRGKHVSAATHELGAAPEKSEIVVPVNGLPTNSHLNTCWGHQCQVVSDFHLLGVGKKVFQEHCRKSTALIVERDWRLINNWFCNASLRGRYRRPISS